MRTERTWSCVWKTQLWKEDLHILFHYNGQHFYDLEARTQPDLHYDYWYSWLYLDRFLQDLVLDFNSDCCVILPKDLTRLETCTVQLISPFNSQHSETWKTCTLLMTTCELTYTFSLELRLDLYRTNSTNIGLFCRTCIECISCLNTISFHNICAW